MNEFNINFGDFVKQEQETLFVRVEEPPVFFKLLDKVWLHDMVYNIMPNEGK